jgi:hypothetical protein
MPNPTTARPVSAGARVMTERHVALIGPTPCQIELLGGRASAIISKRRSGVPDGANSCPIGSLGATTVQSPIGPYLRHCSSDHC